MTNSRDRCEEAAKNYKDMNTREEYESSIYYLGTYLGSCTPLRESPKGLGYLRADRMEVTHTADSGETYDIKEKSKKTHRVQLWGYESMVNIRGVMHYRGVDFEVVEPSRDDGELHTQAVADAHTYFSEQSVGSSGDDLILHHLQRAVWAIEHRRLNAVLGLEGSQ